MFWGLLLRFCSFSWKMSRLMNFISMRQRLEAGYANIVAVCWFVNMLSLAQYCFRCHRIWIKGEEDSKNNYLQTAFSSFCDSYWEKWVTCIALCELTLNFLQLKIWLDFPVLNSSVFCAFVIRQEKINTLDSTIQYCKKAVHSCHNYINPANIFIRKKKESILGATGHLTPCKFW